MNGQYPPGYAPPPQYPPGYAPAQPPAQPQGFGQPPARPAGMPDLSGFAAGNANARYLPPGEHVADVKHVKCFTNSTNEPRFAIELDLVETDQPIQLGDYSVVFRLDDKWGYGQRDTKGFICLAIESLHPGSNPAAQWENSMIAYVAADGDKPHQQPAKGLRFHISSRLKKPTDTIPNHHFEPLAAGTVLGLSKAPALPSFAPAGPPAPPSMPGLPPMPPAAVAPGLPPLPPMPGQAAAPPPWPGQAPTAAPPPLPGGAVRTSPWEPQPAAPAPGGAPPGWNPGAHGGWPPGR